MSTRVEGHPCPKCGGPAVYNGNYYCESWDTGTTDCRWAMHESSKSPKDRAMVKAYLEQCLVRAEKRGASGQWEADRMRFYLAEMDVADAVITHLAERGMVVLGPDGEPLDVRPALKYAGEGAGFDGRESFVSPEKIKRVALAHLAACNITGPLADACLAAAGVEG